MLHETGRYKPLTAAPAMHHPRMVHLQNYTHFKPALKGHMFLHIVDHGALWLICCRAP